MVGMGWTDRAGAALAREWGIALYFCSDLPDVLVRLRRIGDYLNRRRARPTPGYRVCPECDGTGEVSVLCRGRAPMIAQPEIEMVCWLCVGEGEVEHDEA